MDLSTEQNGTFTAGFRFSDFYVWAFRQNFSGTIDVSAEHGPCAILFHKGQPQCVTGPGATEDRLGDLLVAAGACTQNQVDLMVRVQDNASEPKPLIGKLLELQGWANEIDLRSALRLQTERRVARLFAITAGPWASHPGTPKRIFTEGCAVEPKSVVIRGLKWHASDDELADVKRGLGVWAVRLAKPLDSATALGAEADDIDLIRALSQPRLLSALEAYVQSRRQARAILRALMLFELVEPVDAGSALPLLRNDFEGDGMQTGEFPII